MGKFVTIDVSGLEAKRKAVETAAFKRVVSRAGAQAAVSQVGLAFRTEGAHYGAKWAPRAASTVKALSARKRKKNGKLGKARTPKPILRDTGTLMKSFFVQDGGGDAFAVATPVRYAKYHEAGTSKMPARPVMPFDAAGNPRSPAVEKAVLRAMENMAKSVLGGK
jgi:phage gpG-like protein